MRDELTLVIGNRNFSSWSMRGWLAATQSGLPFRELQVFLDEDPERRARLRYGPTGRVPVLRVGEHAIWESLAIVEYLFERAPGSGLWPADELARARARSLCSEMHAGFGAIRGQLPLNCRARKPARERDAELMAEVERVLAIWTETRAAFGGAEGFLFGLPCAADWFFAPVASRFQTYSIVLAGEARVYAERLLAEPSVAAWLTAAEGEGHAVEPFASMP